MCVGESQGMTVVLPGVCIWDLAAQRFSWALYLHWSDLNYFKIIIRIIYKTRKQTIWLGCEPCIWLSLWWKEGEKLTDIQRYEGYPLLNYLWLSWPEVIWDCQGLEGGGKDNIDRLIMIHYDEQLKYLWETYIERESSIFPLNRFLAGSLPEVIGKTKMGKNTRKMALCGVRLRSSWFRGYLWQNIHPPVDIYTCVDQPSVSLTCPFHQHVNRLRTSRRQSIIEFNCRLYLGDDDTVVIARRGLVWLGEGVLVSRTRRLGSAAVWYVFGLIFSFIERYSGNPELRWLSNVSVV